MKKLFNYALLAAALLVGVNVNAATVTTAADLQAALNAALDNEVVLFAPADADDAIYGQTIKFYNPGKTITLDLNGTTYTATQKAAAFEVYGGTLKVQKGTIISSVETNNADVYGFKVYGFDQPQTDKISKLIIEKDVFVNMPQAGAAVCVDIRGAVTIGTTTLPSTKIFPSAGHGVAENVFVEIYGHLKGGKYGAQVTGNVRYPEKSMTYVTNAQTADVYKNSILSSTDSAKWVDNVPKVTIYPSAVVEGGLKFNTEGTKKGMGVYAAGYAEWTISGTIFGATGVLVKDGIVTLKDANIYSIWTEDYVAPVGTTSGSGAAGSGVVIESSSAYAGKTKVTVKGDTKITGKTGYGIEQAITNGSTVQLDQLNIQGGEIAAGGKGTVVIEAANQDKVTITAGSSEGGTWTVKDGEGTSQVAITEFIPKDKDNQPVSHKIEILDAEGKVATTVIVPGPAPTKISDSECGSFDLNTLSEDEGIDFADCGTTQTLTSDLVLGEIIMNSATVNQQIVVPTGKTLTVKYLIMGGKSNITVEAGGTLIVTGELGVKNVSTENITIKSEVNNSGQFLFAPEVVSNKHPKATVEYKTQAINNTNFDRIGVPAYNGMKVEDIVRDFTIQLWIYDNASGWVQVTTVEQFLAPFQGLTLRTGATAAPTLGFPCEVVGNADADLTVYTKWNTFSNSYTANADLTSFLTDQYDAGANALLEATIHKYNPNSENGKWDIVTLQDIKDGDADGILKPMQAIIMRNRTNSIGNITISYADNVWAKRPGAPAAPRMVTSANMNKAVINITSINGLTDKLTIREAAEYSDQFDNGSDATKYPNNVFNMYVATEFGDLCQMASDNVEGQVITLATTTETEFTMSFSNVRGEKMALRDNLTGDVIEMTEGNVYNFMANANEVSERFTVIAAPQAPTALKNAATKAKAAKFVNKGQVVLQNNGRMFNVLGIEVK